MLNKYQNPENDQLFFCLQNNKKQNQSVKKKNLRTLLSRVKPWLEKATQINYGIQSKITVTAPTHTF